MPTQRPTVEPGHPQQGEESLFVRVLGPVDVEISGRVVAIGSRLERKLLAVLAVAVNHAVSTAQLAQVLWGDEPPSSQANTLQTHIHRLRGLLGHDRIASDDQCYWLVASHDELDAVLFEQLVGRAAASRTDREACRSLCQEALAYWRGVPFGMFADEDPFRLEVIRLEELRIFVCELRLETEIALGNEEMVVGALEALVGEYPYRERIWELMVVALALSGRRVEALRGCRDLRAVLAEVGLEPTPDVRQLEQDILDDLPDLRRRLTTNPNGMARR